MGSWLAGLRVRLKVYLVCSFRFLKVIAWEVWRSLEMERTCFSGVEIRFSWLVTGILVVKEITT